MITVGSLVTLKVKPEQMQDISMSYTDFITIMLTAVTVVITILAIFIGILALWGYSQFQKMTETASKSHLEKLLQEGPFAAKIEAAIIQHVTDQLRQGELHKVLVDRIDSIILNDASQRADREQTGDEKPFTD
ncbi:hypothetical protein [Pleomorphomonas sp. PLEO]|uniref:hypothetical protein n=1 Tax=Pleomorphomonas sp. PLEO TaxID=3239306 RepID=UPI00351E2A63